MDRVFTLRLWLESAATGTAVDECRVRIRYVNLRREYHVQGLDNAFAIIRSLLLDPLNGHCETAP